jgi:hypothetical protein
MFNVVYLIYDIKDTVFLIPPALYTRFDRNVASLAGFPATPACIDFDFDFEIFPIFESLTKFLANWPKSIFNHSMPASVVPPTAAD